MICVHFAETRQNAFEAVNPCSSTGVSVLYLQIELAANTDGCAEYTFM